MPRFLVVLMFAFASVLAPTGNAAAQAASDPRGVALALSAGIEGAGIGRVGGVVGHAAPSAS